MALGFKDGYTKSIEGRRLGLQTLSTAQTGGIKPIEFLIGPDAFRQEVVTETTGTNIKAVGISLLSTAGVASSTNGVFVLDPPFAGARKTLVWASTNTATNGLMVWASTGTYFRTTGQTSAAQLTSSQGWIGTQELFGLSTSAWLSGLTTGFINTTATT